MSLPRTEQTVLDHIQANRPQREYWQGKIAQFRAEGKTEDEVALALSENLHVVYMGDESVCEDLEGLVDYVSLMTANYDHVAWALMGRNFKEEAVAAMIPEPEGWPGPYYIEQRGKKLGPFSYAQIRISWAEEEINGEDKAFHSPSGEWRPAQHLAEPWTAPGWVKPEASTPTPSPEPPTPQRRTVGTKERPLLIAEDKFMIALARCAQELDGLFGKDKWELIHSSDFKDGGRVWMMKTPTSPGEQVYIRCPGLAAPMMPDGSPNILMDLITHQHVTTYRKLVEDAFVKGIVEQAEAKAKAAAKPEKEEESTFTSVSSAGCAVLLLVGIGVLVFASSTATRVWTVVIGIGLAMILGVLSDFFDKRLKKKKAAGKKL